MSDSAVLLKRARDLFQQGLPGQAEEIVGRMLRDNPRDATALNFRAYLLYRRGSLEDALAAYRTLRPSPLDRGLGVDRCLSHLGALERYRPSRILVTCQGDVVPEAVREHLGAHPDGIFAVA